MASATGLPSHQESRLRALVVYVGCLAAWPSVWLLIPLLQWVLPACSQFWPPRRGCCLQGSGFAALPVQKALDPAICMEWSPTPSSPGSNAAFSVRLFRTTLGETVAYFHPPDPPLLLHFLHSSHHLLNYFSDIALYFLSPAAERQRWQMQDHCFLVTTLSAVPKTLPGWTNCSTAAAPWMSHPSSHCPLSSVTMTLRRGSYPPLLSFHHGGFSSDLQPLCALLIS